jgi:hypothetical protein
MWSSTRHGGTKQPRGVYNDQELESDKLEFIFDFTSPHSPHSGRTFNGEPEQAGSGSPSESEDLTSVSLSAYDCDSEGEEGGNDIDSEDDDDETRATQKPGLMNLRFQLDAVKAGECCDLHPTDHAVDCIV